MTRRTDLGGLNLSRIPKVFIECGNMRNAADASRLADPAWRARAAAALVQGLRRYLEEPADTPTPAARRSRKSSGSRKS